MTKTCIFVIGVTNVGKTTYIDNEINDDENCGGVFVGREFRKRYPPDHFQGSGSPVHTEAEAMQIYKEQFDKCVEAGKQYIFVDGQPRNVSQIDDVFSYATDKGYCVCIHFLCTDIEKIKLRISLRDLDEKEKQLSLARLDQDRIDLFEVIQNLLVMEVPIHTVVT